MYADEEAALRVQVSEDSQRHVDALAGMRAEVERLKEEITQRQHAYEQRTLEMNKAEDALARVRAALEKYGKHDPHCPVEIDTLLTYDASRPVADCTCGLRAALEGRR